MSCVAGLVFQFRTGIPPVVKLMWCGVSDPNLCGWETSSELFDASNKHGGCLSRLLQGPFPLLVLPHMAKQSDPRQSFCRHKSFALRGHKPQPRAGCTLFTGTGGVHSSHLICMATKHSLGTGLSTPDAVVPLSEAGGVQNSNLTGPHLSFACSRLPRTCHRTYPPTSATMHVLQPLHTSFSTRGSSRVTLCDPSSSLGWPRSHKSFPSSGE